MADRRVDKVKVELLARRAALDVRLLELLEQITDDSNGDVLALLESTDLFYSTQSERRSVAAELRGLGRRF